MSDWPAKGRRVSGMFIAMLGAGFVLESRAYDLGMALALVGLCLFLSGFVGGRSRAVSVGGEDDRGEPA